MRAPLDRRPQPTLAAALALTFALAVPFLAAAEEGPQPPLPADSGESTVDFQSTFCDGTYALCIKAPCSPIPTLDRIGNYYVEHALCECQVVRGWSMGPGSCPDRAPMEQHGRTFLISTYSNRFNAEEKTLACGEGTTWAWCYGAPCVVDELDRSKATCTCPVETGPGSTLGGDCRAGACDQIWSAASPAGDVFANERFYRWMQENHPGVPANPPAAACPAAPPATGG
jgi:hypothetical protein